MVRVGVFNPVWFGLAISATLVSLLGLTGCSVASVGSVVDSVLGSETESSVEVDTVGVATGCVLDTGFVEGSSSESVRLKYAYCVYSEGVIPVGTLVDDAVWDAVGDDGMVSVLVLMKMDMREFPLVADKMFPLGGDVFDFDVPTLLQMRGAQQLDGELFDEMLDGFTAEQVGGIMVDDSFGLYSVVTVNEEGLLLLLNHGGVFHIMLTPVFISSTLGE